MTAPCPEFGFPLELDIASTVASPQLGALGRRLDAFLAGRGLLADGARSDETWRLVVRAEAGQATDNDRDEVERWALAQPEIADVRLGELTDLREER